MEHVDKQHLRFTIAKTSIALNFPNDLKALKATYLQNVAYTTC